MTDGSQDESGQTGRPSSRSCVSVSPVDFQRCQPLNHTDSHKNRDSVNIHDNDLHKFVPNDGAARFNKFRTNNPIPNSSKDKLAQETGLEEPHQDAHCLREELLSEALLAVASAEEYAAKITKLQQACLTPLKEDLADWLNKIMSMSNITTANFMDKLDNGVIICHLAKVISSWCKRRFVNDAQASSSELMLTSSQQSTNHQIAITSCQTIPLEMQAKNLDFDISFPQTNPSKFSTNLNICTHICSKGPRVDQETSHLQYKPSNVVNSASPVTMTPMRQLHTRSTNMVPIKLSSQSTNCLLSSSMTNINEGHLTGNKFLTNLIRMEQTKIWEGAKCRTFYARDNVCNFIRWSKEFGVNQSVLFESDDLVLHANTRQVVLCLLDVARIACVKHGFTEAPGLVKFEQECDREMEAASAAIFKSYPSGTDDSRGLPVRDIWTKNEFCLANLKFTKKSRTSIADHTDDLIMRYCLHKEEEARKKAAKIHAHQEVDDQPLRLQENLEILESSIGLMTDVTHEPLDISSNQVFRMEQDSLMVCDSTDDKTTVKPLTGYLLAPKLNTACDSRVDSLDSGEGRTESASTSHSRTPPDSSDANHKESSTQEVIERSNSNSSLSSNQTSCMCTSELSSSRSSLFSGQDSDKRHIASDLDGKVMRIAKSYYGKGATKGVTRLSEGKYKIADRIVFVRLLKGHRVMVRIGGGWDTLENFLFRHKSDPSQVIDVDNLLPLETKITFDPQVTPSKNGMSKLPFYKRSSSASSTNLSTSNLSNISIHSPTNSNLTSANFRLGASSIDSPQRQSICKQSPNLLMNRGRSNKVTANSALPRPNGTHHAAYTKQLTQPKITPNRYTSNRPIGFTRTPAVSASNLYSATLTTRPSSTNGKSMGALKLNSTTSLQQGQASRQEPHLNHGRSNDSLQASFYKSPQYRHQLHQINQNGCTPISWIPGFKKRIDSQRKSTNVLVRQANSMIS